MRVIKDEEANFEHIEWPERLTLWKLRLTESVAPLQGIPKLPREGVALIAAIVCIFLLITIISHSFFAVIRTDY